MSKRILKISIWCILYVISASNSFGQTASNDSTYLQNTIAQTESNFRKAIGQESRLYNGPEYLLYDRNIKGNALYPLDATTWQPSEVNYDGIVYKGVPIMYDIYRDQLAAVLYNRFSIYVFLSERVHDFTLFDHHFVRIVADSLSTNNSGVTTGFYDQLYGGKIEVLAKRIKNIQNSTSTIGVPETYFSAKNEYYIKKGNIFYNVSSKRSFLNVLKDKKSLLQKYIRENNISFRDNREAYMAQVASYYDHLAN
jgi:hypothetical protein